jgi:hypothetical protein
MIRNNTGRSGFLVTQLRVGMKVPSPGYHFVFYLGYLIPKLRIQPALGNSSHHPKTNTETKYNVFFHGSSFGIKCKKVLPDQPDFLQFFFQ